MIEAPVSYQYVIFCGIAVHVLFDINLDRVPIVDPGHTDIRTYLPHDILVVSRHQTRQLNPLHIKTENPPNLV